MDTIPERVKHQSKKSKIGKGKLKTKTHEVSGSNSHPAGGNGSGSSSLPIGGSDKVSGGKDIRIGGGSCSQPVVGSGSVTSECVHGSCSQSGGKNVQRMKIVLE
ncbi:unnamed protein product, partial [Ilex paraguariensis]